MMSGLEAPFSGLFLCNIHGFMQQRLKRETRCRMSDD
jgi:hypothetical protein